MFKRVKILLLLLVFLLIGVISGVFLAFYREAFTNLTRHEFLNFGFAIGAPSGWRVKDYTYTIKNSKKNTKSTVLEKIALVKEQSGQIMP